MNRFHFGFYTDINIDQRTLNKAETCSVTHEPHWFTGQSNMPCQSFRLPHLMSVDEYANKRLN